MKNKAKLRKNDFRFKALICTAIFAAMSIVFGKLIAINIGDTFRISFENLPIILASLMFGPVLGGSCGVIADILGCIIRGYAINPGITAAAAVIGIIPGLLSRCVFKTDYRKDTEAWWQTVAACMAAHIVGSMIVKTVALHIYYGTSLTILFITRIPLYIAIGAVESYLCSVILNNKTVKKQIFR